MNDLLTDSNISHLPCAFYPNVLSLIYITEMQTWMEERTQALSIAGRGKENTIQVNQKDYLIENALWSLSVHKEQSGSQPGLPMVSWVEWMEGRDSPPAI